MNYMGEIAKMLGVELGERFDIKYEGNKMKDCYFDEYGLYDKAMNASPGALTKLLNGTSEIVKKPFRPKSGDEFFYINRSGYIMSAIFWDENTYNIAMLCMGNCFRSEAEAEAHKEKIVAKLMEVIK